MTNEVAPGRLRPLCQDVNNIIRQYGSLSLQMRVTALTDGFLAYQPKTVGPELFMVVLSRAILGDRGTRSFDPNSRQLNTAMATS